MDFTDLYKRFSGKVYRVCLGFCNDSEEAKDLTQETFIAVWQNINSFRKEADIGTWIYRIATNKCLRLIEKESRKADMEKVQPMTLAVSEEISLGDQDEKMAFLRKTIASLPEIDRIIITLYMEDVLQERIAKITGLTHGHVRVKVHRIKEAICKKFKENGKF